MNLIKDGSGKKTVECKSMGYVKSGDNLISKRNENRDYRDFYSDVINDIQKKMKHR